MPRRAAVQAVPGTSPVRQKPVHQRRKPLVVVPLQQVHQFMHNDVLQAPGRFLGQFQIDPDPAGIDVAAAPLGLHLPDAPSSGLNACHWLPLGQQRRDQGLQLFPVPAQKGGLTLLGAGAGAYEQVEAGFAFRSGRRYPSSRLETGDGTSHEFVKQGHGKSHIPV